MRPLLLALLGFLFFTSYPLLGQSDSTEYEFAWEVGFLGSFTSFGFDGSTQVFDGENPFGIGIERCFETAPQIGAYIAPLFDNDEALDTTFVNVAAIITLSPPKSWAGDVIDNLSLGLSYTFFREGDNSGLVGLRKENLAVTLSYAQPIGGW